MANTETKTLKKNTLVWHEKHGAGIVEGPGFNPLTVCVTYEGGKGHATRRSELKVLRSR